MQQTLVLCPFYNDVEAYNKFALQVDSIAKNNLNYTFSLLVVNDGTRHTDFKATLPLHVLHLHRNMGHQKAIAIGLSYASENLTFEKILIMDCDGEDRPEDIPLLLKEADQKQQIIVAQRGRRMESLMFRFYYKSYKAFFRLLTGRKINFGNFMILPASEVKVITRYNEIWNHLAGTILKSGLPFSAIPVNRGTRYSGKSKMNFYSLLLHGLGAIGVFLEVIAARLLFISLVMIGLSAIAIALIVFIKLFTQKAIPGWATSAVSSMLIVLLQSFLLSLFTVFIYHSSQGQRKLIPANDYAEFIESIEKRNIE